MVQAFYLQDVFHDSVRLLGRPQGKPERAVEGVQASALRVDDRP
jgi:hypothetical protein